MWGSMETLRLFHDVAKCHSFSQAAELHGVTQSAASQRISALEKKLGVTLLDRSVRPLVLTEAGKVFLAGCGEILERYDQLQQKVKAVQVDPAGTVRIAAIYSSGIELLNQIREEFETEHPKISVHIRYEKPDAVYHAVVGQDADLGILSYPQRWKGVGLIPLRDEVMAVVCRPSHELAGQRMIKASDLSPYEMVTFDDDLPAGRRIKQYLREQGALPTITHSFDNIDTIKSVVSVTHRFAILPQRAVMREVAAGSLTVVRLEPTLVRPLGVIFRRPSKSHDGSFSPAVQAFVDYLLANAGPRVEVVGGALETLDRRIQAVKG